MPTHSLFGKLPRAKPRKLMHAIDAGSFPDGRDSVHMVCGRCGYDNDWAESRGLTQDKRGWPCPKCNGDHHAD